jgi:hypothetical protein
MRWDDSLLRKRRAVQVLDDRHDNREARQHDQVGRCDGPSQPYQRKARRVRATFRAASSAVTNSLLTHFPAVLARVLSRQDSSQSGALLSAALQILGVQ